MSATHALRLRAGSITTRSSRRDTSAAQTTAAESPTTDFPRCRALLSSQPAHFQACRTAVAVNASFLANMLALYESDDAPTHLRIPPANDAQPGCRPTPGEAEKVRYVLRNLSRDWSAEGAAERGDCYAPMIASLRARLAPYAPPGPAPRILVPGAGLGRLCCECASAGYATEGNECSYYMLLTSSFVMNVLGGAEDAEQGRATVHPWVLSTCNNVAVADALRPAHVPDVSAGELAATMPPGGLGMAAGDFAEVYRAPEHAESFDAVLTCFFIDCSHNILDTVDIVAAILKPGGVWVNHGPLLYHWADAHTYIDGHELSIEVPLESVKAAAVAAGFEIVEEGWRPCSYADDVRSMMHTRYDCATWTMVKR